MQWGQADDRLPDDGYRVVILHAAVGRPPVTPPRELLEISSERRMRQCNEVPVAVRPATIPDVRAHTAWQIAPLA